MQDPAHEILDLDEIELTEDLVAEALAKLELRLGGPPVPMIRPGEEEDVVTACVGKNIADAVVALGEVRGKRGASAIRDEVRQLRPISRGLMLIYLLDTAEVEGLNDVRFVPALALSFPATNRAKRVQYKVNPTWIKEQLKRFELEESPDEED